MAITRDLTVEQGVLKTFQTHLPSVYFSDKGADEFARYEARMKDFYRMRMKFPPEMFAGKTLLDLGAGTGENTVYLARWGARCTLVEMNPMAQDVSRRVFAQYAGGSEHEFILSSLFEWDDQRTFDIVHSRGVFSHTSNKEGAFRKLASHLKPGGFLIFGDPNKAGGFQNMLQRWILYRFSGNDWQELQALSERLFREDIDRSQAAVPRTREAIIYDRWVVPQQDDPSVTEVFSWFREAGLEPYSSWPFSIQPAYGDSTHEKMASPVGFPQLALLPELIWMLQNEGDASFIPQFVAGQAELYRAFQSLTDYVSDVGPHTQIETDRLTQLVGELRTATAGNPWQPVFDRLNAFCGEVHAVAAAVEKDDLDAVEKAIRQSRHLFRGMVGNRHVDYIAYRKQA